MLKCSVALSVSFCLCALITLTTTTNAAVVYNSTQNTLPADAYWTPDGFVEFDRFMTVPGVWEALGDDIILAGSERTIVGFDVVLMSRCQTTLSEVGIKFYANDLTDRLGRSGIPGTILWSTTVSNVELNGLRTIHFDVPSVDVPDRFTWMVSASSVDAGLVLASTISTGSSSLLRNGKSYYWDYMQATDYWACLTFREELPANYAARFEAIPEPTSLAIFSMTLVSWLLRRRRVPSGIG